jgi:hypothetical protein
MDRPKECDGCGRPFDVDEEGCVFITITHRHSVETSPLKGCSLDMTLTQVKSVASLEDPKDEPGVQIVARAVVCSGPICAQAYAALFMHEHTYKKRVEIKGANVQPNAPGVN